MFAPGAARMARATRIAQATQARMFHASRSNRKSWMTDWLIYRENRVPYYQRLYQRDDGKRIWWKSHRSPYLLYPFYVMLYGTSFVVTWSMIRLMFGYKTFW